MKLASSLVVTATTLLGAQALVPGNITAEKHLAFPIQQCSKSGCTPLNTEIVFDANWRYVHDNQIEGVPYSSYGLSTSGDAATLNFITNGNVGSRSYILNGNKYYMFKLLGKEISFDIDTSNLYCGMNGAVYFIQMDEDGGMARDPSNKAGAAYGLGYCDAQCPNSKFATGKQCCMEMDLWEANKISTQVTSHTCTKEGPCSDCTCDAGGCFFNTYKFGAKSFYGPGAGFTVDSSKKMTVVTQFLTDDGTSTGTLTQIRRLYKQNGKVLEQAKGTNPTSTITDAMCPANYKLPGIGKALQDGMVLSLALWTGGMTWLDSGDSGTCTDSDDQYNNVVAHTDAKMIVSNIRFGDIGTTYGGGDVPNPTTSTPTPSTTTSTPTPTQSTTPTPTQSTASPTPTTTATPSNGVAQWGQCGGINYTGSTTCKVGKCVKLNDYYYQCQ